MIRATSLPIYRDAKDFDPPEGVQSVLIDPESLELATSNCPTTRTEVYVTGSAPTQYCEIHGGHNAFTAAGSWLSHVFGGGQPKEPPKDADGKPLPYDPTARPMPPDKDNHRWSRKTRRTRKTKRKRVLSRRFLVSLEARRRTPTSRNPTTQKSRTRPSRTKETRHDFVSNGGAR